MNFLCEECLLCSQASAKFKFIVRIFGGKCVNPSMEEDVSLKYPRKSLHFFLANMYECDPHYDELK